MTDFINQFRLILVGLFATIVPSTQPAPSPSVAPVEVIENVIIESTPVPIIEKVAMKVSKPVSTPVPTPSATPVSTPDIKEVVKVDPVVPNEIIEKAMAEAKEVCGGHLECYRQKVKEITDKYAPATNYSGDSLELRRK